MNDKTRRIWATVTGFALTVVALAIVSTILAIVFVVLGLDSFWVIFLTGIAIVAGVVWLEPRLETAFRLLFKTGRNKLYVWESTYNSKRNV